jgi:Domain of unknown function (DUF1772)
LPAKINLSREDYLTVQQIYRGWELLGIIEAVALVSTLVLTWNVRHDPRLFRITLIALLCIGAALAVFFIFTFPANQQTNNWAESPANWLNLRKQWEYSHATRAGLFIVALNLLIISTLQRDE